VDLSEQQTGAAFERFIEGYRASIDRDAPRASMRVAWNAALSAVANTLQPEQGASEPERDAAIRCLERIQENWVP
jgi:hypothetical protein